MRCWKALVIGVVAAAGAFVAPAASAADLKVATLHPLFDDLARQIGGDRVEIVTLLKPGGDPHRFAPSAGDMARIQDARLVLASGKGMESYLDRLEANLGPGTEIFEVGRRIPSLRIEVGPLFVCCPAHSQGSLDPHWWHSIRNMQRALRYLADEFARVDPANADFYRANAREYSAQLDELNAWARRTLAEVPRSSRILATAHAAFGYFCREFGFRAVPVQGLDAESDPSPSYLAETIDAIRSNNIPVVFPEQTANPKVLESLTREAGVKLGPTLIADATGTGRAATYEGMMRHNIEAIASALGRP